MSIEKDIKQYNKFTELTKLVNKINKIEEQGKNLKCDIDLQDLLLALNKKHKKSVNCYLACNSIFILFDSDKKTIEVEIKLKKPLSNQKEVIYNKLIKILK